MTRAELAFSALDKDHSGYISTKELRKLSAKLSEEELQGLMMKVGEVQNLILWFVKLLMILSLISAGF